MRSDLRPAFRRLPKWVLALLVFGSLPLWVVFGMIRGVRECYKYWKYELDAILSLDKDLSNEHIH